MKGSKNQRLQTAARVQKWRAKPKCIEKEKVLKENHANDMRAYRKRKENGPDAETYQRLKREQNRAYYRKKKEKEVKRKEETEKCKQLEAYVDELKLVTRRMVGSVKYLQKKIERRNRQQSYVKKTLPDRKKIRKFQDLHKKIREFFTSDVISSPTPSAYRGYIARGGLRKRKRLLQISNLKALYAKFLKQNGEICNYETFIRWKPFWVLRKKFAQRDTCSCIKCMNANIFFRKAKDISLLLASPGNLDELMKNLCCDSDNVECVTRSTSLDGYIQRFEISTRN